MDDDGVLTFRGRLREVIIRGGLNIYPAEVEHAMTAHESISEIAVFGVPDERLGERVVAAVLPKPGTVADPAGVGLVRADAAEPTEAADRVVHRRRFPSDQHRQGS